MPAAGRVPILLHQANAIRFIQRDHRGAARMMDDLQGRDVIVGQPHFLDVDLDDAAAIDVGGFLDAHGIAQPGGESTSSVGADTAVMGRATLQGSPRGSLNG